MIDRPDTWLLIAMWCAATWRVSHLLVYETGPFNVFVHLRARTGIKHDEEGLPIAWPDGNVFVCVWCLSVWVAGALFPAMVWAWPVVGAFAASAASVLAEEWYNGTSRR